MRMAHWVPHCEKTMTWPKENCIITGTDTNAGKTLCAIHCLLATKGTYWKPIQSGLPRDRNTVQQMTGLDDTHFLPELYDLSLPLSPHEAALHDKKNILLESCTLPQTIAHPPLIIEGAGGVLVPINQKQLMIDLFCKFNLPVIVAARSTLGTINHTLMTLKCLRQRNLKILGVVVVGPWMPKNEQAIAAYGQVNILDRICRVPLTGEPL